MSKTKLVYKDAKSHKFWEVEAKGSSINILYGRVGNNGQTSVKKAKSPDVAKAEVEKLIKSKLKKGFKKK